MKAECEEEQSVKKSTVVRGLELMECRQAAADPALATGEERSHLPRPALGSRKEGGRATPLGVGEQAFSLELSV